MNATADTYRMHLSLNVRNIQRSIDFYTAFLGQAPAKARPDYAKFEARDPGLILTLNKVSGGAAGNALSHLGLRVGNDARLRAEHERIVEAGIPIELEENGVSCCYAVQNKFWVRDPDGNAWEIYRFIEDADAPSTGDGESCCATDVTCSDTVC